MKKLYRFLLNKLPRPLLIRLSYPFKKLAPLIYRGNNVSCPVCGKSYRKFLSYGSEVAHREGVLCPGDLTLERHRLMWLYLRDFSDFFTKSNLKVLHMAPEQCFLDKFKAQKNLDYLTADIVSPIADIHFDLHNIPIEDNRFDIVFCNHVMEHVDDPNQCMSELFRVMRLGGWAIMQVPQDFSRETTYEDKSITSPEEREKHYWQKDHVRLFGKDYPDYMRRAGFEIEEFHPKEKLGAELFEKYRLQPSEILYIARKK
ncbi:methyltransferase domain-containing protein [Crocinitomicaceae bacterium]|jgi:SAM-dependent methyltransferase|nr:methyltransferase domain-containing protein [Crocinitomicaceae bacterium]MDG1347991.1 methyltransferase domain-containing protein [Crocinitomicaceae bacterium]MDG2464177.1 methyltransferase domain-containing protein [Crocinitomicaceae bacterium]